MHLRFHRLTGVLGLCLALGVLPVARSQPTGADGVGTAVAVVSLRPSAAVSGPHVCLADVAAVMGGDAALRRRLMQLDLTDLSPGGPAVSIPREQVVFRIRLAGLDPQAFVVEGAARAVVKLAVSPAATDDVVETARRLVLQRLPWKPEDIAIRAVGPVRAFHTTGATTEPVYIRAELRTPGLPLGRVRVDVVACVHEEPRETVPVDLDVKLLQRVALAARRIEPGEVLTEDKLQFDQRTVDRPDRYVASADSVLGKRARTVLNAGQVITATEVESAVPDNPVLVHTRDTVRLVAHVGPLRVTAVGEALQDGREGQIIRVRNVDSSQTVLGRVRDRQTVEVSF